MLFRRQEPILRNYVSESDCFLCAIDLKPGAGSASRRAEEKKAQAIAKARDTKTEMGPMKRLWEDF